MNIKGKIYTNKSRDLNMEFELNRVLNFEFETNRLNKRLDFNNCYGNNTFDIKSSLKINNELIFNTDENSNSPLAFLNKYADKEEFNFQFTDQFKKMYKYSHIEITEINFSELDKERITMDTKALLQQEKEEFINFAETDYFFKEISLLTFNDIWEKLKEIIRRDYYKEIHSLFIDSFELSNGYIDLTQENHFLERLLADIYSDYNYYGPGSENIPF